MLLTIDIGNTHITLGVWDGRKWKTEWRLRTAHRRTSDEYGITLTNLLRESRLLRAINEVVIASVVPPLTTTFAELSVNYLKLTPTIIDHTSDTGITVATDNPSEVGTDRIINAAAAYHRFPGPSIVIDMGTATTFDIVSDRAELLGVAIAPGLRLAADALANQAAQLSQVPLQAPPSSIGTNTTHAVQSGLIFGYVSLIEGMVRRISAEHPNNDQKITIIGTGGLIELITPHTDIIDHVDPWLTLTGLRVISARI